MEEAAPEYWLEEPPSQPSIPSEFANEEPSANEEPFAGAEPESVLAESETPDSPPLTSTEGITCQDKYAHGGESAETEEPDPEPEIHFRVSSGQLELTSEYFRGMLDGDFTETQVDPADGLRHIGASGWDPDALLIVLNVLHARGKHIRRALELPMLARVAQVVDYYFLHDTISYASEIWLEKLKAAPMPTRYCMESVLWIWVSWVFKESRVFEKMMLIAVKQSRGPIQTLDLPISGTICCKS